MFTLASSIALVLYIDVPATHGGMMPQYIAMESIAVCEEMKPLYEADARAGYSFTETVATGTMSQAIGEAPKPTMVEVKRRYRGVRAHGVCKDLADMLIVTPTR